MGLAQEIDGYLKNKPWLIISLSVILIAGVILWSNDRSLTEAREEILQENEHALQQALDSGENASLICQEMQEELYRTREELEIIRIENQILNRKISELGVLISKLDGSAEDVAKAQYLLNKEIERQKNTQTQVDDLKKNDRKNVKLRFLKKRKTPIEEIEEDVDQELKDTTASKND